MMLSVFIFNGMVLLLRPCCLCSKGSDFVTSLFRLAGLGEGGASSTPQKGSTGGRLCDLPWVVLATYSRFFRRPTVGSKMPPSKYPDVPPREVTREAGCERVETSGLLRPNFTHICPSSERANFRRRP